MSIRTLKEYIKDIRGVDIDRPLISSVRTPFVGENENPDPFSVRVLPKSFVPSIEQLVQAFLDEPRTTLRPTLDQLVSELLELEQMYEVVLLNPAVTEPGQRAHTCWKLAEDLWERKLMKKGDQEARRAVTHSIRGLIAGYQHTAAHKIVTARLHIETIAKQVNPEPLLDLHKKAQDAFVLGRDAQVRPQHDEARRRFKEAMLSIGYLNLVAEELIHLA